MFQPFERRIGTPRVWTRFALHTGRGWLALWLVLLPSLALVAGALVLEPVAQGVADAQRMRDTFARFISGLITAATIAVGFATLSMKRGIKGLGELQEHVDADRRFVDRVRELTGKHAALGVGPLLGDLLDVVAQRSRAAGLPDLEAHARDVAARVRAAGIRPDALLIASIELDAESALQLARSRGLEDVEEAMRETDVARSYIRTLATQWGLARMSQGIAITSFPAVLVATAMVLAYPEGGSLLLAAGAFALVMLPLAVFVSFVLRFIFLHQHTLPLGPFVLGPENPSAAQRRAL